MRCAICDKDDDSVTAFNPDCSECQEIIYDTIAGYEDDPEYVSEETKPEFMSYNEEHFTYSE